MIIINERDKAIAVFNENDKTFERFGTTPEDNLQNSQDDIKECHRRGIKFGPFNVVATAGEYVVISDGSQEIKFMG